MMSFSHSSPTGIKQFIGFCFFFFGIMSCSSSPITEYSALLAAVKAGRVLHFTNHYELCKLDGGPGVNATGGAASVGDIEIDNHGTISFSTTKLIYNYQSKKGGYTYNNVRTYIYSNNSVILAATDLVSPDPNSAPAFYTEQFVCALGKKGVTFYASAESLQPKIGTYDDLT